MDCPTEPDQSEADQKGQRQTDQPRGRRWDDVAGGPGISARRPNDEEELPSERIEEPRVISGIAMQREAEAIGRNIEPK